MWSSLTFLPMASQPWGLPLTFLQVILHSCSPVWHVRSWMWAKYEILVVTILILLLTVFPFRQQRIRQQRLSSHDCLHTVTPVAIPYTGVGQYVGLSHCCASLGIWGRMGEWAGWLSPGPGCHLLAQSYSSLLCQIPNFTSLCTFATLWLIHETLHYPCIHTRITLLTFTDSILHLLN